MYYVAHRLFGLHDRALGALIADRLASVVGGHNVFLPFCDTDEEDVVSSQKGRLLYEMDCARLRNLDGMIAVLHGPSLDDGVCMEIGYAAAAGVPVIGVTTDFQTYGISAAGPRLEFPDPLVEIVLSGLVRVSTMGPDRHAGATTYHGYAARNTEPLVDAASRAVALVRSKEALVRSKEVADQPATRDVEPSVYVEPSPYAMDAEVMELQELRLQRGRRVVAATRFTIDGAGAVAERARSDWRSALDSSLLVIDLRGPECPPGGAMLIGAAVHRGRLVLGRVTTGMCTFAPGREPNLRNLMIHYSLSRTYRDMTEFRRVLDDFW